MARQLYDYWFVQFDFPDDNGKPYKSSGGKMVWNEKLKRDIPEGWNDGQLIDIANITMGQSPDGSTYNEIEMVLYSIREAQTLVCAFLLFVNLRPLQLDLQNRVIF